MLDFIKVSVKYNRNGSTEIYPKFVVPTYKKSEDLMIRGGDFYAVWDEERGSWTTSEERCLALIDQELRAYAEEHPSPTNIILYMWDAENGMIDRWIKYKQKQLKDSYEPLDEKLIFSNSVVNRSDYASKRLAYPLEPCPIDAWDTIVGTLYSPEERHKIEWAIGAIVSGDSRILQKFLVFYGSAGTGKSTILNIIQKLFDGYYSVFDAKALGNPNNAFALESFKGNPLVAIQHDGDLSKIEDNTRLNSIVSHELMTVNEKYKATYANRFIAFLLMGTNRPVKITDAKSGILRRLIDVSPSGNKLDYDTYIQLMNKVNFELGGIACHCLEVYSSNKRAYDNYIPLSMMGASNDFYNFVFDSFEQFKNDDGTSLTSAWKSYKVYCEDANVGFPFNKRVFKEELKNYFDEFIERYETPEGRQIMGYYKGFKTSKFEYESIKQQITAPKKESDFVWECEKSVFDEEGASFIAQYATDKETPKEPWVKVKTVLSEIDTKKLHYVRVPENHIVIDFDLKDENGNKSFEKNVEAARKWPKTYAEVSKGGNGIHLHYIYNGDPKTLAREYAPNIEIKVFVGSASLRRKLTLCNDSPINPISCGLPLKKEEDNVIGPQQIKNERNLRRLIVRNLLKDIMPGTKPSIDFIKKILDDAYERSKQPDGMQYDVSDMRNDILVFASRSSNHASYCIGVVNQMHFQSVEMENIDGQYADSRIMFLDTEVYSNLFVVCWKWQGSDTVFSMINPTPYEVEELFKYKIVGFNNRKYDNHILWARSMGYSNEALYQLSQMIVTEKRGFFSDAYNLSYTDIYDFASAGNKMGLKKWEIKLGIHHQEMGIPWDKPVPDDMVEKVVEYCCNDVRATEKVFEHLKGDWTARLMLAELTGMTPNDTTNALSMKYVFGDSKHPQNEFMYRDLSKPVFQIEPEMYQFLQEYKPDILKEPFGPDKSILPYFPGYIFVKDFAHPKGYSLYMDEEIGEGGYVWAKPGMYWNVWTFDVASQHPNTIVSEFLFGKYTLKFVMMLLTRLAIKHKDFEEASRLISAAAQYLKDPNDAKAVSNAMKTVLNSAYGLTAADFDNPYRDPRNVDNIVAKRGALFMCTLKHTLQDMGVEVIHCKTDSIKVVNPTQEIYDFIIEFGKRYGYDFEIEHKFEKICLVNDAVYIAKLSVDDPEDPGEWTATGTQFAIPYIFKTLFSKEPIEFKDLVETKNVKEGALYLDMNEALTDVGFYEGIKDARKSPFDSLTKKNQALLTEYSYMSDDELNAKIAEGHDYRFVGGTGGFVPIKPGYGGGELYRIKDGKASSAAGAKGWRWMEAEEVDSMDYIDMRYYETLAESAIEKISQFGDFNKFVSDEAYISEEDEVPWA